MHVLLNDNSADDILFVQEPWYGWIGTKRADADSQGKEVWGGTANPKWSLHSPICSPTIRAKVMTYIWIHDRDHPFRKNYCKGIIRNNLCSHPMILITDLMIGTFYWRMINFYNDVDDPSSLWSLMDLDLDSTVPTLLVGDFNIHSRSWSPMDWTPSHNADRVEEWLATQTFTLLSALGIPTHRGEGGVRDSTLDLVWCNFAASIQNMFLGAQVDWKGSVGSDHALIHTTASTPLKVKQRWEDHTNCFDTDISTEDWKLWSNILRQILPPITPLLRPEDIDECVNTIYHAFNTACAETMKRKGLAPGFCSKWWNDNCREATRALQNAENEVVRHQLHKNLKYVVKITKREWADSYITTANIWEVAAWRHGQRSSHIPALVREDNTLTYDHEEMADLLSCRFFAEENSVIPTHFHNDPPPLLSRSFHPFTQSELEDMLTLTKNNSAPGTSGIGWFLLKKGWPHMGTLLAHVFTACVNLAHHPAHWKEAKVVIPKPDKPNYSHAKAHRPISLLETMSKLMEKVVAKRMQHDIVAHELIPTTQFGGHSHSSCLDVGITLIHDVQTAHATGLKVGILLFDV